MRQDGLQLGDSEHRDPADEEEEEREEEPEAAEIEEHIGRSGGEITPGAREVVAVERGHDDDVALEPHTDVDEDRRDEHERHVRAELLRPEELRRDHVAADHRPIGPIERAPVAVMVGRSEAEAVMEEDPALVGVTRIPGDEELHRIGVSDHETRREHELIHELEVLHGGDVLEAEDGPHDEEEGQDERKAREDRTCNEVRGEDRRMPARDDRGREVERNDRVDRENERGRDGGEDEVRALIMLPAAMRTTPAKGEKAVDALTEKAL